MRGAASAVRSSFCLALTLACSLAWTRAGAQDLVADLSSHLIAVTTGFAGTSLLLFGATQGEGDVVVVVRGPDRPEEVRQKKRRLGIWVNRDFVNYATVPSFYVIASSRALAEIAPESVRRQFQLGLDELKLGVDPKQSDENKVKFTAALLRNKLNAGLFAQAEGRVRFLGPRLFRTDVQFPSNVPTGDYIAVVYLIRDGQVTTAQTTPLNVSKLGTSAQVSDFAHTWPALHGAVAVAISVLAGFAAAAALRKV